MKRIRLDLHSHTWYSHDSLLKPEPFVAACLAKGINAIAVTDHNEIEGAKAIARLAPFKVIIGEEIRTRDGEITGLFLKQRIVPNLSARDTVREIRRQKGLVYIPHPFAAGVTMRIKATVLDQIADEVDIIEGFNSRALLRSDDVRAQAWARKRGIPFAAGSDAHTRFEIGAAFMEMDDFTTPKGLLKNLPSALLYGRKTHVLYPATSLAVGRAKLFAGHRSDASRLRRGNKANARGFWEDK